MLDLDRIDLGQLLVTSMSAVLAPYNALASPSVWNGKCLSVDRPAAISESNDPPRVTIRIPSEVFVVERLPRK